MYNTIAQTITSINRKVSPGNVNQSRDLYGALAEGARRLLGKIKPKELSKRVIIENALYDQVFKYKCPDDLDQQNVMQWFRLKDNRNVDTFYHPMRQTTNRAFDQQWRGNSNLFTIEWDKGVRFIKVSATDNRDNSNSINGSNNGTTIHDMNSLTDNGTWNTFGNVTNLVRDNLTYVAGNASLRFDINDSSNTGGLENFNITPVDLSSFMMVGKVFTWLWVPNLNQIQTVQLEMYSSDGNGYSITVNSPHDTDQFQLEQNMLGFVMDPNTMVTIGTPDPKAINHIKITFTTNGTLLMQGVRLDNIVARKGTVYGIQYISNFMFRDRNGLTFIQPQSVSDDVMLDFEAYQLYLQECACVIGEEIFTDTARSNQPSKLAGMYTKLDAEYAKYKKLHKAEYIDEQQDFYRWGVPFGYNSVYNWQGYNGGWDHSSEMY